MWIPFLATGGRSTSKRSLYSRGQGAGEQPGYSLIETAFSMHAQSKLAGLNREEHRRSPGRQRAVACSSSRSKPPGKPTSLQLQLSRRGAGQQPPVNDPLLKLSPSFLHALSTTGKLRGLAACACMRSTHVCRWVDQLLQAASKHTVAGQSPNGIGTDGHLLAPSPLGMCAHQLLLITHHKSALCQQD